LKLFLDGDKTDAPMDLATKQRIRIKTCRSLPEAQPCEVEGCDKLGERHHDDYAKPLDVRWLCRAHHVAHHRQAKTKWGRPAGKNKERDREIRESDLPTATLMKKFGLTRQRIFQIRGKGIWPSSEERPRPGEGIMAFLARTGKACPA
jgi:hypothetical protein